MKNYKITVSYDGTRYKGWQSLKSGEATIQGKLESILSVLAGEEIQVSGSGRTDAGVHAVGQTASFHLDDTRALPGLLRDNMDLCPMSLMLYFNRYLPEDIAVTNVEEMPVRFHARYGSVSKTYRYTIRISPVPDVFRSRFEYNYTDFPLNIPEMKKAAELLIGEHDFTSFCGNRHMKKSAVRSIYSIDFFEERASDTGELIRLCIDYTGNGFLQNMIRILTGTLIEVGTGRRNASSMPELLNFRDREKAGYTAPAKGLCLMRVEY